MPRDLRHLPALTSASDLVTFLRDDASDRVLVVTDDKVPDEIDGDGTALRMDTSLYVVVSMRALGARSLREMIPQIEQHGTGEGEVAVVGDGSRRDRDGRVVPHDIRMLIDEAEEKRPNRILGRGMGSSIAWVLTDHPEVERGSTQIA